MRSTAYLLMSSSLLIVALSACSIFNGKDDSSFAVVKGEYAVVRHELDPVAGDSSVIQGVVYDKATNTPAVNGFIRIPEIVKGSLLRTGSFRIVVSPGKYKLNIYNTGNTELWTDSIEFKRGYITELVVHLRTRRMR